MGVRFRKSIKMGPVRVNLSKSGIGYSVGTKGARITKTAKGKTRTTISAPGTGLSYTKTISNKKKKASAKQAQKKAVTLKTPNKPSSASFEKSWLMAVIMAVFGFGLTWFVSFIALFVIDAIVAFFNWDAATGKFAVAALVLLPVLLGIVSAVFAFRGSKPDKEKDHHEIKTKTEITAELSSTPTPATDLPGLIASETSDRKEKTAIQIDPAIKHFETELLAIPQVDISLSEPVARHLLKDLPPYSFSNITRKTRLDSIFPLVFLDVETTGLAPSKCEILEVSAIKFDFGMIPVSAFTTLCKPKKPIPEEVTAINHITDEMVADAPTFSQIAPALTEFIKGCNIAGHNLDFDLRFIFAGGAELPADTRFYDTLDLAHLTIPESYIRDYKLDTICRRYGIKRRDTHRSLSDCYATSKIFSHLVYDKTSRQLVADTDSEAGSGADQAEKVSNSDTK